jgi:hypothetical protein
MREMKEFPEQALLQFLVGRTVGNVVFQPYSIDFTLDDNSYLVVEHLLEYVGQHGAVERLNPQEGFGATALHRIVSRVVTSVVREPFSLTLHFDNGHSLKVHSIPGRYESGHISGNGDYFVF